MTSDHLFPLLESERDTGSGGCSSSGLENPGFGLVALKRSPGDRGWRRVEASGGKNNGETGHHRSGSRRFRLVNKIGVRTCVANPDRVGRGCNNRVSGLLGQKTSFPDLISKEGNARWVALS